MSLQIRLTDFVTAIGTDIKQLRVWMTGTSTGDLTGLTTTAKTSVVAAINEVKAAATGSPPAATELVAGVAEVATQAETTTGTDDGRMVTPLKLVQKLTAWAQPLNTNLTALAALAGQTTYGQALLTLANQAGLVGLLPGSSDTVVGVSRNATQTETNTGTLDTAAVTPLKLQTRMAAYAQPLDADLTSIAALATTTFGRSLLTPADAAATRTLIGLSAVAASGSASDITTGTLPTSVLPPLAINDTFVVISQAAMLALTAQRGDVAIRTDTSRTYILSTDSPGTLADWKLVTAAGDVISVAGRTGTIVLTSTDVGLGNVDNTSDVNKPVSTATTTALGLKAPIASPTFTGTVAGITATMVGLGNVNNTSDANKPISTAEQTALNLKQDADVDLTAIAALVSGADKMPYATGIATWAMATVTAAARTLLDDVDVTAMRATLSVYSQAEMGNPETDLVAAYNTAKA